MTENSNTTRIDSIVQRLVDIASDLKTMIAVNTQRLDSLEKVTDKTTAVTERLRDEAERSITKVYDTIQEKEKSITSEVSVIKDSMATLGGTINKRIDSLEKSMWIYLGGLCIIVMTFSSDGSSAKKIVTTLFTTLFH